MRCPKCGYLTFDHLETCTRCRKNIAEQSQKLAGTVYKAAAPSFLQFEVGRPDTADTTVDLFPEEDGGIDLDMELGGDDGIDLELALDEDELFSDARQEEEVEFDFTDEGSAPGALMGGEEGELDLSLGDEDSVDIDSEEKKGDSLQLDFSEFDISDLAPPAEEEDSFAVDELTLDDETAAPTSRRAAVPPGMGRSGAGLEDLQMDDLDLGMPSLPPKGSVSGGKLRPSVKTGTALDDFDIDLGDLISEKEK